MADTDNDNNPAVLRQRISELERSLKDAGSQWSNLLESIGDSVFILDPLSQAIFETNSNAARRLGYSRDEILSLPYSQIEIRMDDASRWELTVSQTTVYEGLLRCKDGSELPVEVSSRMVHFHGKGALLNIAREISLRKQAEAEREQLIAELDAYAHTVAHDLKNPVALLMGYSEMLAQDFRTMSEADLEEYLGTIYYASIKMRNIIDDLLMLASIRRLDEVETEALDMGLIIKEAMGRLTHRVEEAAAVIDVPRDWPTASGYGPWVEEVWANYVSNAIKYGGTPPHITLGATEQGAWITFWVRDNGKGISAEDQAHLFEEFTRFDKSRAEGHGLGLSIVKSIVGKLGGTVGAESMPGQGSTFYFTLPAA